MAVRIDGPKFYGWDNNGNPLAGGKLYAYETGGTSIPKDTYTGENTGIANTNPVILNGSGYADVYLDGRYNLVLYDQDDNLIWSKDPVSSGADVEWIHCQSASYVDLRTFEVNGDQTDYFLMNRRVRVNNDGIYFFANVFISSYSSGVTQVQLMDSIVAATIQQVCLSIITPDSIRSVMFDSVLNMQEAPLANGDYIETLSRDGEWTNNNALAFGGAPYQIMSSSEYLALTGYSTPDEFTDYTLNNGQIAVQVKDNFDCVSDMLKRNLKVGDIVSTISYYRTWKEGQIEAIGGAQYQIMDATAYESLSGSATPDGYGDHLLDNGLIARLIQIGYVNVVQWGVEAGVQDDPRVQAAVDRGMSVYFPALRSAYVCSGVQLKAQQKVFGDGRYKTVLMGDGTDWVLKLGDGVLGSNRTHNLIYFSVINDGAGCINIDAAPNATLQELGIAAVNADALSLHFSFRINLYGCFISTSGNFVAAKMLNNINGLRAIGNTMTGGSAGTALVLGQSQGCTLINNIIESSYKSMLIASTNLTGDGNCNGLTLLGNYIEQSAVPFSLGTVYSVFGLTMKSNYVGNSQTSVISDRTSVLAIGRVRGGEITSNAFYILPAVENLLEIVMNQSVNSLEGVYYGRNYVNGTPLAQLVKSGTYADNSTINNSIGRLNVFDFGFNNEVVGKREYVTGFLKANANQESLWFSISGGDARFGGEIEKIEIIEATGSLTGCHIAFGNSVNYQANVAYVDITTFTYNRGKALVPLVSGGLDGRVAGFNYFNVYAGAGTGQFRMRITYRAN